MVEARVEVGEPGGGIEARKVADCAAVADDLHAREADGRAQHGGEGLVDRGVDHVAGTAAEFAAQRRRGREVEAVAEEDLDAFGAAFPDASEGFGIRVRRVEEGEADAEARQFGVDVRLGKVGAVRDDPDVQGAVHG